MDPNNPMRTVQGSNATKGIENDRDNKIIRRDVERKRRRDMSALYASLRSELPLEYIKGRRSTSDHMNEAVNYIKNLQNNIKELSIRRDELKSSSSSSRNTGDGSSSQSWTNCVTICPCFGGVKIMFSSGFHEENLQLSKVMEILLEERLNVVTCDSTKVNDRLLHSIHCEVTDPECFNLSELQQKLDDVVILSLT